MAGPPKHFIYRSRSKIELLAEQLDQRRVIWGLAASAKVPGFEASFSPRLRERSTAAKMDHAIKKLDKQGMIGTVEQPGPYFRGEMDLSWGAFGGH